MPSSLIYALFFLSGGTGLVYELVWVRELIFVFGGTTYAITTVLVAFMAGLGLGSYAVGRVAHRLQRPSRLYGALEIGIGLYALLVPFLLRLAEPAYRGLYPHVADMPWLLTAVRFCLSAPIVLLPATAMGATLPVLVRYITLGGGGLGRSVGRLYGINTLGAVAGTLAAGFWLIPGLGLTHATWLAAAVNVLIGSLAIALLRPPVAPAAPRKVRARTPEATKTPREQPTLSGAARLVVLIGFAVSGFAAMVYQITWTRALVMSLGSSTYAFTCILAAFILGLALGSLVVARWVDRWRDPVAVFGVFELLVGLVATVIIPIHGRVPLLAQALIDSHSANFDALLRWEFLLIIAVTFVPTFLMGAIFPLVTRTLARGTEDAAAATGRAYAVNTVGTIAGSFLAGFVLIRGVVLGVQNSIVLASLLNGVVGAAALLLSPNARVKPLARRAPLPIALLLIIPIVAVATGRWNALLLNAAPFLKRQRVEQFMQERQLKYVEDGVDVTVAVLEDPAKNLILTVNGKPDASTGPDATTQLLLGHVPALMGPAGKSACIIGLGSGMTLAAVSRYPSYERLDCVEISDEVVKAAAWFNPYTYNVLHADPRVHLIRADGRNHLLLTDQPYDLIVSEPSNPWMSGVSNLFTHEFFELCKSRLSEDGVLGIWLQSYTMSLRDFQMVVRTLFDSFDHVSLWQLYATDCMLVASRHALRVSPSDFEKRFQTTAVWADLYRIGLFRPTQILGRYIVGDEPLRAWVADAPVHTDDNALLEFSAPRYLYADRGEEISRALMELQRPPLKALLPDEAAAPHDWAEQVAGVVAARWATTRADQQFGPGREPDALRFLLGAYRQDASNVALYLSLRQTAAAIPPNAAPLAGLKAEIDQLTSPWIVPLTGATLPEIAVARRMLAGTAARQGRWAEAADDLFEASRLAPADRSIRLDLARAYGEIGRMDDARALTDELDRQDPSDGRPSYLRALWATRAKDHDAAMTWLGAALRSGAVTADKIATDDALKPLHDDPRFAELLGRAGHSQPATAP